MKNKYIDMGLPSGNLWAVGNEIIDDKSYFTYDEAMENFGKSLPSKEDFEELLKCCYHRWDDKRHGIEFLSENGNKLFFSAQGYLHGWSVGFYGIYGYYWSLTPFSTDNAYYLSTCNKCTYMNYKYQYYGCSVRLIKRK